MTDSHDTTAASGDEVALVPASVSLDDHDDEFHVSELLAGEAGASSPFGLEGQLPLPADRLWYAHPRRADRPNLADGR